MLAKAVSTANHHNRSLGMAPGFIAGQYVFERVPSRTSFKSTSVSLPTNCMFVVVLIDGLGPVSYAEDSTLRRAKVPSLDGFNSVGFLEARGGIEPPMKVLQTFALPLGYRAPDQTRFFSSENKKPTIGIVGIRTSRRISETLIAQSPPTHTCGNTRSDNP